MASSRHVKRRVPLPALLVAVSGILLTFVAFVYVRHAEERVAMADLSRRAAAQTALIQQGLERTADSAHHLANLVRAAPNISGEYFRTHAAFTLERYPGFYSVAWSEWVTHERRAEIVSTIVADGYDISDLSFLTDEGTATLAPDKSHYLVIRHFYPLEDAGGVIGSDILARPMRPEAVSRTIDTGDASATGPVRIAADPLGASSILVFAPVYSTPQRPATIEERRAAFRGTVSIGVRTQAAMESWLGTDWPADLCTVIFDTDARGQASPIFYGSTSTWSSNCGSILTSGGGARFEQHIEFGGRRWHVVHAPAVAFGNRLSGDPAPWIALLLGILLSLATAALVALHIQHHEETVAYAGEREEAAAVLDQMNSDLRRVNSEIEQLVSAVSHDLKNALLAMEWTADAVERGVRRGDADAVERGLSGLRQSLCMMQRLMDDLLAHSHAGSAPFAGRWLDSDALVREVLLARAAEAEGENAEVIVAGELPVVFGDYTRLFAAFDNLIGNAFRYGRPAGVSERMKVEIGCQVRPSSDGADPSSPADAEGWSFYVRDNGPGVPPEARTEVFEMFKRLDARGEGTGIGLAIVKRVAEVHRGEAWVEEAPGGGALFWLSIPRLTSGEPPPRRSLAASSEVAAV